LRRRKRLYYVSLLEGTFTMRTFCPSLSWTFVAVIGLAACEKNSEQPPPHADLAMTGMELPAPSDMGRMDAAADSAKPADMTEPFTPIPGSMLGVNVMVNLACDYERRGWVADAMGVCQRTFSMNKSTPVKTVRIDALAPGKYKITAGKSEMFAMDYSVEASEASPYGVWTDGADPVASVKLTHIYTLQPRSLRVETDSFHDNDTPLPPATCPDYYFERTKCVGDLTW
jgi:hypothetical protein